MPSLRRLLVPLALLALAACPDPTSPAGGLVTAQSTKHGIVITNAAEVPARYVAYSPNWLGLLAPCTEEHDLCPRVPARTTITVPWSEVAGYEPSASRYRVIWSLVGVWRSGGSIDLPAPIITP